MRKCLLILLLSMGLVLSGCAGVPQSELSESSNGSLPEVETSEVHREGEMPDAEAEGWSDAETGSWSDAGAGSQSDTDTGSRSNDAPDTGVVQGGPYGQISVSLPAGWKFETWSVDSDDSFYGEYGVKFYPEDVDEGYVTVAYIESFGVCGTGLVEETAAIAGKSASVGTYDNHEYWDFIAFGEDYKGIVALTSLVNDWWSEYSDQVDHILNTLVFDRSVREGSVYVFDRESENDEIGLSFSLKNISSKGATIIFSQYDENAAAGELIFGDDFVLEQLKDGEWERVPVEGDYGFHDIAYVITPGGKTERELNWEWLYGELTPGEYRIGKGVLYSGEGGEYGRSMIYARFILN